MKTIKEKPKGGKTKGKGRAASQPALTQRQAAKLLRDQYVQQLDPRPEGREGQTEYAVEQVEAAERFAADELTRPRSPRQRGQQIKEKSQSAQAAAGTEAPSRERAAKVPRERAAQAVKTRSVVERPQTAPPAPQSAQHAMEIKERSAAAVKEASRRTGVPLIKDRSALNIHPSIPSSPAAGRQPQAGEHALPRTHAAPLSETPAPPGQPASGRRMADSARRRPPPRQTGASPSITARSAAAQAPGQEIPKRRAGAKGPAPKIRGKAYPKGASGPKAARPPLKTAAKSAQAVKQTARQRMTRQAMKRAARQAGNAARKAALLLKRAVQIVVKATAALVSFLASLVGGGVLLLALVVVIIIGAVASSPFGLFFSAEHSAPGAVSAAEAVAQVNMAYNAKLEEAQAGTYDRIELTGQPPDWAEVLAVFAIHTAGGDGGIDVVTLDQGRVEMLTAVFWDMCAISATDETIDHPASGSAGAWTERILHITITAKTADDMRAEYAFTDFQNSALDELLSDRASLSALAGSLQITAADALALLQNLPADLAPERRAVVETACSLVGKINYFWGGKSLVIGWDARWGQLSKVWADGSSTTGTYRPYGLDCSGMVDWVFYNITGGEYIIGHGGGAHAQHTYCAPVSWAEAQPGDLVFYPDDEHVGIVGGWDESGNIQIIHCASGQNNVVITGKAGFTTIGRPIFYGE